MHCPEMPSPQVTCIYENKPVVKRPRPSLLLRTSGASAKASAATSTRFEFKLYENYSTLTTVHIHTIA